MKNIIVLILGIIIFSACNMLQKTAASEPVKLTKEMYFSLFRGSCYGTCPSYKITINGDASFSYFGKAHVKKLGAYTGNLTQEETENLFNKLSKYDWTSYPNEYPIDNVDFPQFVIEYFDGETKKEIVANSNAASELINLSKNMDALINSVSMQKSN